MSDKEIQLERTDAIIRILELLVDECIAERKTGIGIEALVQLKREMQKQYKEVKDSK